MGVNKQLAEELLAGVLQNLQNLSGEGVTGFITGSFPLNNRGVVPQLTILGGGVGGSCDYGTRTAAAGGKVVFFLRPLVL